MGAVPVKAASVGPQPPPGFELMLDQPGVWLYRKDYKNGTPDYVQVIDLRQGAALRLLHAPVSVERPGRGAYGGSDARLGLNSLEGYWRQTFGTHPQVFCVTNGQFFYMPETPTRLALPLKVDGAIITEGFGYDQYPEKLMLELWSDHADIALLTAETLYASSAPDILGGLPEEANKRAPYAVGRTFIGVDDWDGDEQFEIVYLFNTPTASQDAVAQVLRDFGAEKVMMLDGGGSTQLICQGESIIPSDRNIPQAIAVLAAPPLPEAQPEQPLRQETRSAPTKWADFVEGLVKTLAPPTATPVQSTALAQDDPQVTQPEPVTAIPSQQVLSTPQPAMPEPRISDLLLVPLLMMPIFLVFFLLLRAEQ